MELLRPFGDWSRNWSKEVFNYTKTLSNQTKDDM